MDLSLTLSQKLALSQRMQQSAEILQMSSQELLDYVKELSVENPVVEFEQKEETQIKFDIMKKKMDFLNASDEQNKTYYEQEKEEENDYEPWNMKQNTGESLEEYVLSQVNVISMAPEKRAMVHYIAESMDTNGYLEEKPEEISKKFSIDIEKVYESIHLIQSMEPAGIGAYSLKECLFLQMKRREQICPLAVKIIETQLEALGKNQIPQIAKRLKVKIEEVVKACEIIKSLNPKPGAGFCGEQSLSYITPDIIIEKVKEEYRIQLNESYQPQIKINGYYKTMMAQGENTQAKEYVYQKMKQVEWVMQCIAKRNATLTKTMEAILKFQRDFFEQGPGNIRPLRLLDVAQQIEMHESTVSRAIRDKYIQCSWGIFSLHYFFSTGVSTASQEKAVTPEYIKQLIKELIEEENKQSPLSDREITEKLNEKNIEISRRTVAKYRESMEIPGTSGRKTF